MAAPPCIHSECTARNVPGLLKRDVPQARWERIISKDDVRMILKWSALWMQIYAKDQLLVSAELICFRGCCMRATLKPSRFIVTCFECFWLFSTTLHKPVSSENNHVSWMSFSIQVYFYLVFSWCSLFFIKMQHRFSTPPVGVKRLLFNSARVQCSLEQISSWNCLRRAGWVLGSSKFRQQASKCMEGCWWNLMKFKMSTYHAYFTLF